MDVIYGLIPGMIILGLIGLAVFFWAARTGQFDDLEGDANRIIFKASGDPAEVDAGRARRGEPVRNSRR